MKCCTMPYLSWVPRPIKNGTRIKRPWNHINQCQKHKGLSAAEKMMYTNLTKHAGLLDEVTTQEEETGAVWAQCVLITAIFPYALKEPIEQGLEQLERAGR